MFTGQTIANTATLHVQPKIIEISFHHLVERGGNWWPIPHAMEKCQLDLAKD